ncbi:MAG: lipoyl(octanoyl) transferase LipB [Bdellovibrionales bacterium]|nr:lipoyl(octanoyl) transferase LipB [Bdellovibrionales bacterium]
MDFEVLSLPGLTRFSEVHSLQKELLQKRIEDQIPDTFIFCEHHPVITRGRGLQFQPDRAARAMPLPVVPPGTDYVEIERGGDLTWHGPGQLVMYPIIKLGGAGKIGSRVGQDIDSWVRFQERVWSGVFGRWGLETHTQPGGSGVWIKRGEINALGIERKLVSVGIALRKWVSYHGTAGNIINDPMAFLGFDPCGFESAVMIRAQDLKEIPNEMVAADWRVQWERMLIESVQRIL